MWPPPIRRGALDAVAARALALQRSSFLRMLRVDRALRPVDDASAPLQLDQAALRVKAGLGERADALIEKHATTLPSTCKRAPGHLQVVALAIAAQRELLNEARSSEAYMAVTALKVSRRRRVVAFAKCGGLSIDAIPTPSHSLTPLTPYMYSGEVCRGGCAWRGRAA